MKQSIIFFIAIAFFASSCQQASTTNAKAKVDSTQTDANHFGVTFDNATFTPIVDVMEQIKAGKEFKGVMEGRIMEVCQKAGCWANLELPGKQKLKVKFRDANGEEFGIDKNAIGKIIDVHGVGYMDTISVAMQKHYAEDNNDSKEIIDAIKAPKISMVFKADGAVLK
ncbi:MAG: hypothetical protein RJA07_2535 [Bacteroidota bacterium]|jgi:hypothetical protein